MSAERYVVLGRVDPRQTEPLLTALREEGIAAYAEPTAPQVGPYLDVRVPATATDRIQVDAARLADAQRLLALSTAEAAPTPQPSNTAAEPSNTAAEPSNTAAEPSNTAAEPSTQEAWDQIVAGFDAPSGPVGAWPALEDLDVSSGPAPARERLDPEPEPEEPAVVGEDEGHFVPPPPPPIPVAHPITFWAWTALLGGIVVLIGAALIGYDLSPGWSLVAVLLVAGGFVTLVARMRDSPPTDSGPDDGAVV